MRKNSAHTPMSSGYSQPPWLQKKPLAEVNFTATIMKMTTAAAAKRVSSPSTSRMPPISSVQPTNVPQNMPGREAEAIEQRGVAGKAHAAERSEQLLHAMRDENSRRALCARSVRHISPPRRKCHRARECSDAMLLQPCCDPSMGFLPPPSSMAMGESCAFLIASALAPLNLSSTASDRC